MSAGKLWYGVAVCLMATLGLMPVVAQQAKDAAADQVRDEAGFRLKASGIPEVNDWAREAPVIRLPFSVERRDKTAFTSLSATDIAAAISGRNLPASAIDLRSKNSADTSVILVIDTSGSMLPRRTPVAPKPPQPDAAVDANPDAPAAAPAPPPALEVRSIDKLTAAKGAIQNFLNGLKAEDQVAIVAFDETPKLVHPLSADKVAARRVVDQLQVNLETSRFTALYGAAEMAIEQARSAGARNIIFLTDGMEDTQAFRDVKDDEKPAYKADTEKRLADLARADNRNIRIFTVGLGDPKAPVGSITYVDTDTLDKIAGATNAGRCACIDLAELAGTVSTADQYSKALTSRLAGVLEEVSKTFHYDYTLELSPDKSMLAGDGSAQTVRVDPAIGRVHLPVEFTFTWSPPARPVFGAVRMLQIFITAPPPEVSVLTLTEIYLAFAGGLALLLTIPPALNAIDTRKQLATVKNSVMTVQAGSSYIGGECPNERGRLGSGFLIRPADVVVVCPGCGTAHHLSCWHSTQDTCWVRTCRRQMTIPPAMLRTHGLEEV